MVGTGRFELPTCRLGGGRSIQLSYVPTSFASFDFSALVRGSQRHSRRPPWSASMSVLGRDLFGVINDDHIQLDRALDQLHPEALFERTGDRATPAGHVVHGPVRTRLVG